MCKTPSLIKILAFCFIFNKNIVFVMNITAYVIQYMTKCHTKALCYDEIGPEYSNVLSTQLESE